MKCSAINNINFKAVYYEDGGTPTQKETKEKLNEIITPEHVKRMEKQGYDIVVSNGRKDSVEIGIVPQIKQQESYLKYKQSSDFEPDKFCDNIEKAESFKDKVFNVLQ